MIQFVLMWRVSVRLTSRAKLSLVPFIVLSQEMRHASSGVNECMTARFSDRLRPYSIHAYNGNAAVRVR